MEKDIANKQREYWVDNVKVLACILVVVGHFFQSMEKSNLIESSNFYRWFMQMIYCFHVPLFFICSGYLYQKLTIVNNIATWKSNVLKKMLALGIPYFTFSIITYLMKEIFSSSVNTQNGELLNSLFFHPLSPYWYLYALFVLFLVTPTFVNIKSAYAAIIVAVVMKLVVIACVQQCELPKFIEYVLLYEVWFVLGMTLSVKGIHLITKEESRKKQITVSTIMFVVFMIVTIVTFKMNIFNEYIEFTCGILACFSVIIFFANVRVDTAVSEISSRYTMSIYLMHTIFAAGFRSVLFKLGIYNVAMHIIAGLVISFLGPIIAMYIMKKTKYLEFFVNPGKLVRLHKQHGADWE